MTPDNPKQTVALATLASFGLGGIITPTASIALLVAPDALVTTATALSLSVRFVGGAIGYSIYYNVFVRKLTAFLPAYTATYAINAGLAPGAAETFVDALLTAPAQTATVPGLTPQILAAAPIGGRWAYAEALHFVWYTSIPFGVVACICRCFFTSTAKYQTNRVAVAL
ncbi:uncharacterized protein AB675_1415 [Cyphellophora attinorum]|uniref:HC-toxin efflux carrier TOXA n=1 Tax=Cyphellophora attinorum TaxID=1664694 RepID=A0A0N0NHA2_9EURO|nr:uncharacterized protein AB675_1415 [Phialophora attinorum]KPI34451.1 hypothetical protein AB675_1415 [Phialophora attinorum]